MLYIEYYLNLVAFVGLIYFELMKGRCLYFTFKAGSVVTYMLTTNPGLNMTRLYFIYGKFGKYYIFGVKIIEEVVKPADKKFFIICGF